MIMFFSLFIVKNIATMQKILTEEYSIITQP